MGRDYRCVALVAGMLASCATTAVSNQSQAAFNLPDFELNSVEGDPVRLSEYLGRDVVLLAFWATWCGPCKAELPHLDRIYRTNKEKGFTVLAISMDEPSTATQVAPYVHENGFVFEVLLDPNGKASNLYNTHKTAPYTVLIGRNGTIVSETSGFEPSSLEAQIDKLLAARLP